METSRQTCSTITPQQFVAEMEQHWTGPLRNVSSPALRKVWQQLAYTFSTHIENHGSPTSGTQWTILQPPTGAGKSQGTVVYASILSKLPKEHHPGVLIVTRLKADADTMAREINDLSGHQVAIAYHSDTKADLDINTLKYSPVLVITHRAYELALDYMGRNSSIEGTWPFFHQFTADEELDEFELPSGQEFPTRKLVVIDEALDIVEHSHTDLDGLNHTLGALPNWFRQKHPEAIEAIKMTIELFERLGEKLKGKAVQEKMIVQCVRDMGTPPDLSELRHAMKTLKFDCMDGRANIARRQQLRELHDGRLRSLHNIFQAWSYYAKSESRHTFNSARLLVPEGVKGAIVLDATASSNVLYQVFEDATVVTPPPGSRSYFNVTLHISRGHKTGKRYLEANAKEAAERLIGDLNERLEGRKVFVCCHKGVEPVLNTYETNFELLTGHWGAVDGSNAWQECDAAVIFGLPHLPGSWAPNVFMAAQGAQSTEWLQADDARAFGDHQDIRRALRVGQMITNVVQAINRVHCRRVIDADGGCPVTDVFLMLPNDATADELLQGIKHEMPGVMVREDWSFSGATKKPRRSNHEEGLKLFIKSMWPGRKAASAIKSALGISPTTWERLSQKLQDSTSELGQCLAEAGARFEVTGEGRARRAFIYRGE